jgi:type II secretory pathway component GspD/PulD (secretin)
MKLIQALFTAPLAVILTISAAFAQTAPTLEEKPAANAAPAKHASEEQSAKININTYPVQTLYLHNVRQSNDAYEIATALRNFLPPDDRTYLVPNQNAIVLRVSPEDVALAQKVINDLDRPKKNYRLTFTVTELDGSKLIGTQHFNLIAISGQDTVLKQGSKIPIVTGTNAVGTTPAGAQTQFTYLDVGMNFDATLTEMGNNAMLKSSVEQSSVAPEKSDIAGVQEPIVRQSSLKGESLLTPGKPLVLGSMDIPGSTSHLQIEVLMDTLP